MRPLHEIAFERRITIEQINEDGVAFVMRSPYGRGLGRDILRVIASNGLGWDHVSVSLSSRTPTWEEMSVVRDLCFLPEECCMELHVPHAEHINHHPYALHMWRPQNAEIPRPPNWTVGPVKLAGRASLWPAGNPDDPE